MALERLGCPVASCTGRAKISEEVETERLGCARMSQSLELEMGMNMHWGLLRK